MAVDERKCSDLGKKRTYEKLYYTYTYDPFRVLRDKKENQLFAVFSSLYKDTFCQWKLDNRQARVDEIKWQLDFEFIEMRASLREGKNMICQIPYSAFRCPYTVEPSLRIKDVKLEDVYPHSIFHTFSFVWGKILRNLNLKGISVDCAAMTSTIFALPFVLVDMKGGRELWLLTLFHILKTWLRRRKTCKIKQILRIKITQEIFSTSCSVFKRMSGQISRIHGVMFITREGFV